jgi:serine/threonine protein kinase
MKSSQRKRHNISKRRSSKIQRGGKVLGSGAYGCVIHPNISCKGIPSSVSHVSKIVNKHITDVEEQIIDDLGITKIPEYNKYFVVTEEKCELYTPNLITLSYDTRKDMETCTKKRHPSNFVHYIQRYGGTTFIDFHNANYQKKTIRDMIPYYYQLLEIAGVLQMSGIVHRDIKMDNIVINEEEGRLRLIDFGMACNISERDNVMKPALYARNFDSTYDAGYYIWPADYYLFYYRPFIVTHEDYEETRVRLEGNLRKLGSSHFDAYYDNLSRKLLYTHKEDKRTHPYYQAYMDDCKRIASVRNQLTAMTDLNEKWKGILDWKNQVNKSIDLYSIGVVIAVSMSALNMDKETTSDDEMVFINELYSFILDEVLCQYSPDRISVASAIDYFTELCQQYGISIQHPSKSVVKGKTMRSVRSDAMSDASAMSDDEGLFITPTGNTPYTPVEFTRRRQPMNVPKGPSKRRTTSHGRYER